MGKWNDDNLKELVEKEGYKYIRFERYDGSRIRLFLICPHNNSHDCDLQSFKQGARCICGKEKILWKDEIVAEMLEKYNYKFIKNYVKPHKGVFFVGVCPNGNKCEMLAMEFNRGRRCRCYNCSKENNSPCDWSTENIIESILQYGYAYVSHKK